MTKLGQEINLIEENKFVDEKNNHGGHEEDPTEKLFSEAIKESIENETGVRNAGWDAKPNNINFIKVRPKMAI